jgi:hypothetical protein
VGGFEQSRESFGLLKYSCSTHSIALRGKLQIEVSRQHDDILPLMAFTTETFHMVSVTT